MRQYRWKLEVRSYEGDAWGCLPTPVMLRYLEHSAVAAAADVGYSGDFHAEHNSAWIIHRMTLLMPRPVRQGQELEIVTWISHFARVRGGREYRVYDKAGQLAASGLAEWVYINRSTLRPIAIPREVIDEFSPPGAPLGEYGMPALPPSEASDSRLPQVHTVQRTAQWHECDSMGHVNNANYVSWLDDAMFAAVEAAGTSMAEQRAEGLRLGGEYYKLDYKRPALPGDEVTVTTRIDQHRPPCYVVSQQITNAKGEELLTAAGVYAWATVGPA